MKKSFFLLLSILALSFFIRYIVHEGLRKNEQGIFNKFNTVFNKKNSYNALFIGSSRAETHFNCKIFDSITGLNSYNIGMQGATLPYFYYMLKAYLLNSQAPDFIILSIDQLYKFKDTDTIYKYARYIPYLNNDVLFKSLAKKDKRFWGFKYIPLYSLAHMGNKYINNSIRGYLNKPNKYDIAYYKGFAYIDKQHILDIDTIWIKPYLSNPSHFMLSYIDSINLLSKKNHSTFLIVNSPAYYQAREAVLNFDSELKKTTQKAEQEKLFFIDYSRNCICNEKIYFGDYYHLNARGADVFSETFSNDFKKLFLENKPY